MTNFKSAVSLGRVKLFSNKGFNAAVTKVSLAAKLLDVLATNNLPIRPVKRKLFVALIPHPTFSCAISHIVKLRTKKQVIWSHASSIVTSMANVKALWNRAMRQFVGYSMGHKASAGAMRTFAENSVSVSVFNALPFPAIAGLVNFFPEPLGNWFVTTHELDHNLEDCTCQA